MPPTKKKSVLTKPLAARRIDTLRVKSGGLGPVSPCTLEIRPLTVLLGPQGTGKSLLAQVLYALEELPWLTQYVQARQASRALASAEAIFATILDQLRSTARRFAVFADGTTRVSWKRGAPWEMPVDEQEIGFAMYPDASRTRPLADAQRVLEAFAQPALRPVRHAVFVPTERMVVSQIRSALAENVLALPITYELFADWLELAQGVASSEPDHQRAREILELSQEALGGRAHRVGRQWKWSFAARGKAVARRTIDLDMASSGQRANWSLGFLASALFDLRKQRGFARELTLFVEEPELHLHPAAEVAMAKILAILVNGGFRVVVTTHSLNTVYQLNNLLLARKRFGLKAVEGAPPPSMRLRVADVGVYALGGGKPRDVVDRQEAFILEEELGRVGAELGAEMNYLANLDVRDG